MLLLLQQKYKIEALMKIQVQNLNLKWSNSKFIYTRCSI